MRQVMLGQQQELMRLITEFEATQAESEIELARLARGDPEGRLTGLQVGQVHHHHEHNLFRHRDGNIV